MAERFQLIREWTDVSRERFDAEIRPLRQPAVLRGVGADWPLVRLGKQSTKAVADYLARFYTRKQIGTASLPASEGGRIFYNRELNGYNFQRTMQDLRVVLAKLIEYEGAADPPTLAMQAVAAPEYLPGFDQEHPMPLVQGVEAKLWIGNSATVAPHYDVLENIACVAVGRRRFTLFPPEQLPNLYVGPLENTPAGAPISLVDVANPDLKRFPRFAEAMKAAQVAELGPGDAIYIPYMWWHGVQALDRFNILVNYWWNDETLEAEVPPSLALMVAQLAFSGLSPEQLGRWRAMFDHYIFKAGDNPMAHLPAHARGIFGELTPHQRRAARQTLARLLTEL